MPTRSRKRSWKVVRTYFLFLFLIIYFNPSQIRCDKYREAVAIFDTTEGTSPPCSWLSLSMQTRWEGEEELTRMRQYQPPPPYPMVNTTNHPSSISKTSKGGKARRKGKREKHSQDCAGVRGTLAFFFDTFIQLLVKW